MIFSNSKSIENSISINGVNLQKVDSLKFLGVRIDHQITWNDHITYISNKLFKSIAIIHRANHVLDTKAMYCLYYAILQPHINYCIEVWKILIKVISTQNLFHKKKLSELSVIGPYFSNVMSIRHFEDI